MSEDVKDWHPQNLSSANIEFCSFAGSRQVTGLQPSRQRGPAGNSKGFEADGDGPTNAPWPATQQLKMAEGLESSGFSFYL